MAAAGTINELNKEKHIAQNKKKHPNSTTKGHPTGRKLAITKDWKYAISGYPTTVCHSPALFFKGLPVSLIKQNVRQVVTSLWYEAFTLKMQ